MIKTLENILRTDASGYRVPKDMRSLIGIKTMYSDGIFFDGVRYSKCFSFTDINYMVSSLEEKRAMFLKYSELLNSLDSGAVTKLTIAGRKVSESDFERETFMKFTGDGLDKLRGEYNALFEEKAKNGGGFRKEKYLTLSVARPTADEARAYFNRAGAELAVKFSALGSTFRPLTLEERLRILHGIFRPGEEDAFRFSLREFMRDGRNAIDYIAPDIIERRADCLKVGNRYMRVLYLRDFASYIKDSLITELSETTDDTMLSIDIVSVPTDEAVREVERKLLGVETNITNWQRRQNEKNNFSAVIPYDMEQQRKEAKEYLDDLSSRDQRMMFAVVTLLIGAESLEKLNECTESAYAAARKHMCQLSVLKYQQTDGLVSVIPLGIRRINAFRTLTTESLAVLMPFKVQEISEKGGIYIGDNAVSRNPVICNRENLTNQSAMILGIPGSGKSLCAKNIIWQILLGTDDDICICDPEGEYSTMLGVLPPSMCQIINMSAGGKDRLNAMYMTEGYGEGSPTVIKSQFILSLLEQIDPKGIGPKQKSIVDRCVSKLYTDCEAAGKVATLTELRSLLMKQKEKEAQEIALLLELYTEGSLDIFGHESNVSLDRRVLSFDIHALGTQLKSAGLLVITDTIMNRVAQNFARGKRTHVFIDEFHVVFQNEYSAEFFNSAWRQFRKRNAYPTAITQNVEYLLSSVQASTMLSNSEFVIMLSQAASDREKLAGLMNLSKEQMDFVTNAEPGSGLIRYGGSIVPFVNEFPTGTALYSLMTTRPGEGVFANGQKG